MTQTDASGAPEIVSMRPSGYPEMRLAGPWPEWFAILAVVASVAMGYGVALLFSLQAVASLEGLTAVLVRTAALAAPYLLVVVGVIWLPVRGAMPLREALGLRRFDPLEGVSLALGGAVGGRVVATVWSFAVVLLGFEPPAELDITRIFPVGPSGIVGLVIVAVVVGPVAEEIIFRGVLHSSLRERVGPVGAAVVSSAVFGVVHVDIVWMVVPTFLLGIVLAWLFESTRSLWVPILCHMVFNLTAVVLTLVARAIGVL